MVERVDVAVVGGGMVGSAAALALSSLPLEIALIEPNPPRESKGRLGFDLRVVALSPWGRGFLGELGARPSEWTPYQEMEVTDATGRGYVRFTASEVGADALGHIVENSQLTLAIWECLKSRTNAVLHCPERVTGLLRRESSNELDLQSGSRLRASVVLAADGAASPMRTLAGGTAEVTETGHVAVVTNVITERHHDGIARQWFHSSGPVALLPMPSREGRHHAALVWSCRAALAEELTAMSMERFCARLTEATLAKLGDVVECDERVSFPLRQLHAPSYGLADGVVLVGDAAHVIHPLAGQGVNLGFLDVGVLVQEIERVVGAGATLAEVDVGAIIRRYERRRWIRNRSMLTLMSGFKALFESERGWVRWARGMGMRRVDATPWLKRWLAREAMGMNAPMTEA